MLKKKKTIGTSKKLLLVLIVVILIGFVLLNIPTFEKIIYPYPHQKIVEKYAAQYGVDPLLVVAIIREESKFFPQSQSHKGAVGLMQLMPSTAQAIAESLGDKSYSNEDLINPETNIQFGTWYLGSLEKVFSNNLILVIAAYNGGRGHVQEWIKSGQINPNNVRQEDIPFTETRDYVGRVLKSYQKYIKLYRT
ncbi:soluble lytic murein transglycosylase-like protein [Desulfosporosinus acidiphilus SJ4]|uniref:Soluble lytic murein transglycosylase-like protein n=1 Tax=Desulfosporosinus acidiphilus (strain DSM 22704 / JCM 16185 / SJ4) TaxID=646529 RepID=I4D8Q5_DESAJ|nr:lytic transglycosylase domain-containing protein [Desulfosporosinus acidiphilus]AFM42179.1 soluble lytic murein transglycosylase-like protein [Desulfosporosinus acidiphilus SJ4]